MFDHFGECIELPFEFQGLGSASLWLVAPIVPGALVNWWRRWLEVLGVFHQLGVDEVSLNYVEHDFFVEPIVLLSPPGVGSASSKDVGPVREDGFVCDCVCRLPVRPYVCLSVRRTFWRFLCRSSWTKLAIVSEVMSMRSCRACRSAPRRRRARSVPRRPARRRRRSGPSAFSRRSTVGGPGSCAGRWRRRGARRPHAWRRRGDWLQSWRRQARAAECELRACRYGERRCDGRERALRAFWSVGAKPVAPGAVSYTHLTLPTNREV